MNEGNLSETDLGDLPPSSQTQLTHNLDVSSTSRSRSSSTHSESQSSSTPTTHTSSLHTNNTMMTTASDLNSHTNSCHGDSFSDSSSLPTIPSTQLPKMWPLPYFSFSRLIRGPQQATMTNTTTSHQQHDNSNSSNSALSIPHMEIDPSEHNSDVPSSLEDDMTMNSVFNNDDDDDDDFGDIEEQLPADEPVPLTFEERARLYSYASSTKESATSTAAGNLMDSIHNNNIHNHNSYYNHHHDTDSECSSNASSSDADSTEPFTHSFYNKSSSSLHNSTLQHRMMMTRSILFPAPKEGDPQRSCATYLFSVLVGSVVLLMFGIYALVVVAGLG